MTKLTTNLTTPTATRGGHDSVQLQNPNEQEERNHDVESNVFFSSVPQDDEETEHEPEADDLVTAHGIKPSILRQSEARMIAKHHDDRWTWLVAKWGPAKTTKQKKSGMGRRHRPQPRWCHR